MPPLTPPRCYRWLPQPWSRLPLIHYLVGGPNRHVRSVRGTPVSDSERRYTAFSICAPAARASVKHPIHIPIEQYMNLLFEKNTFIFSVSLVFRLINSSEIRPKYQ